MPPQRLINQKLKPPKAFFDWCYRQIPTFVWKNKQETICASSRKDCPIITKRLTKRSNLSKSTKYYSFGIILVTSKRIEIQTYAFWSTVKEGKQTIVTDFTNLECFKENQHFKAHQWAEGKCYQGLISNYGFMSGPYTNTSFYDNQWLERVKNVSELKYLNIDYLDRFLIANIYKYRKEIEFLQKINAHEIAKEVMYPKYTQAGGKYVKSVDMRTIKMKWLHTHKACLKNYQKSFSAFQLEQFFKTRHGKLIDGIEQFLDYRDFPKIPKKVGVIRFQRWLIRNKITFSYYLDYLELLKELAIPLETEMVLMPHELKTAHDDAVFKINTMKIEIEEKEYVSRKKQVKRLEREIDDYVVVVPNQLNELLIEGTQLQHCVSGNHYIERHKKGETTILFVRNKSERNKPFFTMEYRNKHIIQLRGKLNADPPKEVEQVTQKWLKSIRRI